MVHKIWQPFPEVEKGLIKVKKQMKSEINTPMEVINQKIIDYIDAPGKYIRSGITFLLAESMNLSIDESFIKAASSLELLHLSTLIHDDVIDQADYRRGIQSMHLEFNNRIAIYAGDYLLTVSGRLLESANLEIDYNLVDKKIIERILIGELRQLMNHHRKQMTMIDYLRQIQGKTAILFGLATLIAGIKADYSKRDLKRLFYAGQMIGMAFQLNDDLIDYRLDKYISGKPRLQDIQNGIYTAPFLLLKQKIGERIFEIEEEQLIQLMDEKEIFVKVERLKENYFKKAIHYLNLVGVKVNNLTQLFEKIN